ncbi:MAG: tetratricopeptide repeat protein [Mangrovibacterium sp.]
MSLNHQEDFSEDDEQIAGAVERFKQAMINGSDIYFDIFEYEGVIDYLMEDGEVELANRAVELALMQHQNPIEIKLKKAQILIFNGEAIKALELLAVLEEFDSKNIDVQVAIGTAYAQVGQLDKAINIYHENCKKNKDSCGDLAYDIAIGLQQNNQFEQAIFFLDAAYNDTQNISLLYELGYCYSRIGNNEEGIRYYELFLSDDPFNAAVWYNLGINYNLIEEFQKAIDAYDYALALQEDLDQALFNKGNVQANTGRYEDAIASYVEYLLMNPESEDAHIYLADCYLSTNDFHMASVHYNAAFNLNNDNVEALHSIVIALMSDDRIEAALKVINEVLALEQNNPIYLTTLGNINFELNKLKEAKDAYEKAIAIDANCNIAWGALAELSAVQISFEDAVDIVNQALVINPNDAYLLTKLISFLCEMGDEMQAMEKFEEGLALENSTFRDSFLIQVGNSIEENLLKKMTDRLHEK